MTRALGLECLPWLCLLIGAVFSQLDRYLIKSIDCGTNATTKDNNFTREGDENYITATGEAKVAAAGESPQSRRTLRCFPTIKKNCYDIPIPSTGGKYLVRAWFLYGNYDEKSNPPTFDLHFDGNYWDTVHTTSSTDGVTKEVIYIPKRENITVCVARTSDDHTPFISSIEVRHLQPSMYKAASASDALILINRTAFGPLIRYPDDPYDRIWNKYGPTEEEDLTIKKILVISPMNPALDSLEDSPPAKLMVNAVTPKSDSATTMTLPNPITSPSPVDVYFNIYYQDVASGNRSFVFKIDGVSHGSTIIRPYGQAYVDHNGNISLSNTAVLSWENLPSATLPPIVNAWEFFTIRSGLAPGTDAADVNGLKMLKDRFRGQLGSWSGDPCLPLGFNWEWLGCNNDSQPRVTALYLSGYGLSGSLKDFDFSWSVLEKIDLSNNSFTGEIPESLGGLAHLKELNLALNNLSGTVPSVLKKPGLKLNIAGNNNINDTITKSEIGMIVGICVAVAFVLVVLAFVFYRFCFRTEPPQRYGPHNFSFSELQEATGDFRREHFIGAGGFGKVYKGILHDGTPVAVKRADQCSGHDLEQFQAEINTLSKVSHDFLVKLIGYCQTKDELFLVYEYMVNGTLANSLYGNDRRNLSWEQRLTICVQAASGLNYLHTGFSNGIIHRDVKTSNILVDEKFRAKVSDFGLSRNLDRSHVTTTVKGTWGYLDPEYFITERLTEKSDVYSFGVVLLEVLCARPMNEYLRSWAIKCQRNGKLEEIIDPRIVRTINAESLGIFWETIVECIQESGVNRPTMAWVFFNLSRALDVQAKPVHQAATVYDDPGSDPFQDELGDSLMNEFVDQNNQANQKSETSRNRATSEII